MLTGPAAEDNPYSPTYQFPASTPSPISEGNNEGPSIFSAQMLPCPFIFFLEFFLVAEHYAAS